MKFRRTLRFHGLKRPRVRQTWKKQNLFNLSRLGNDPKLRTIDKTFFQQKWAAKAMTRGYHGEHIKERQWERMFSRRLLSVVDMNPAYMAKNDGSEQAAGRGSGRDVPEDQSDAHKLAAARAPGKDKTPYMQMTFAPQERRLDIAVFRALFASSARQARQFVVHGAVKVNGKKMVYPGYLLNPGDMFQVDPERVMYATGWKKEPWEVRRKQLPWAYRWRYASAGAQPEKAGKRRAGSEEAEETSEAVAGEAAEGPTETVAAESPEAATETVTAEAAGKAAAPATSPEQEKKELQHLRKRIKILLARPAVFLRFFQKWELHSLARDVEIVMSRVRQRDPSVEQSPSVVDNIIILLQRLEAIERPEKAAASAATATEPAAKPSEEQQAAKPVEDQTEESAAEKDTDDSPKKPKKLDQSPTLTNEEKRRLRQLFILDAQNPLDLSKPYHTPWRPKPYMPPFAFIPRYLEVNQKICSAVYLRHPVARQGSAEVPTPFPHDISQLAFNWYLRRR